MRINFIGRPAYLLTIITLTCLCCNNTESSKNTPNDSSEKKFDPAAEQKTTSTYDPKVTATDTMYKDRDSIPK